MQMASPLVTRLVTTLVAALAASLFAMPAIAQAGSGKDTTTTMDGTSAAMQGAGYRRGMLGTRGPSDCSLTKDPEQCVARRAAYCQGSPGLPRQAGQRARAVPAPAGRADRLHAGAHPGAMRATQGGLRAVQGKDRSTVQELCTPGDPASRLRQCQQRRGLPATGQGPQAVRCQKRFATQTVRARRSRRGAIGPRQAATGPSSRRYCSAARQRSSLLAKARV